MIKLSICIEPIFKNKNSIEKLKKISKAGFKAYEFWFCEDEDVPVKNIKGKDIEKMVKISKTLGLKLVCLVVNSPDGIRGGSLNKPSDREKYLERLEDTIKIAKKFDCNKLITCSGNALKDVSIEKQIDNTIQTLKSAVKIAEKEKITLVFEPLNTKIDHKGYLVDSSETGLKIVKKVNSPYLKLLYDVYHMQIMEGNIIQTVTENIEYIGHFHSAGVPGRHELDTGELNYKFIVNKIYETGYDGYFGLEYFPSVDSDISIRRVKKIFE